MKVNTINRQFSLFVIWRKKCLLLNNVFLMSGALLALTSRAAKSFEMIIISRVLIGINAGTFSLSFLDSSQQRCWSSLMLQESAWTYSPCTLEKVHRSIWEGRSPCPLLSSRRLGLCWDRWSGSGKLCTLNQAVDLKIYFKKRLCVVNLQRDFGQWVMLAVSSGQ